MYATRGVEQATVAAFDERRDDFGAARCGQSFECFLPCAIDERSVNPGVAYFAGRKDHERSAPAKPEMGRAQPGAASSRCLGSVEWIDEETGIVQLWNSFKQPVREHSDVRPDSAHNVEKEKAVQCTMRMIGRDDEWSSRWNRRQVRLPDAGTDVERFENAVLEQVGRIWLI